MAIAERYLDFATFPDQRSDQELVTAAQEGSDEAVSALVERYYGRVYSFLTYHTARSDAEDLTQEAFARALRNLHRFNGSYRVGPWLIRIARNLCIDESRRVVNRAQPADMETLEDLDTTPDRDHVWEKVSSQMDTGAVKWALSQLSDRHRAVLILREIEGLSYADIAQVIGTNERGVEGTLRRARAKFRLIMADAEGLEGRNAICRRVIRQVAATEEDEEISAESKLHIDRCSACRSRSRRAVRARGALGLLPPLHFTIPDMTSGSAANASFAEAGRGLLQAARDGLNVISTSSIATLIQAAASLGVAAALAASPVLGTAFASYAAPSKQLFNEGNFSDLAGAVTRGVSTESMAAPILQASSGTSPAAATSDDQSASDEHLFRITTTIFSAEIGTLESLGLPLDEDIAETLPSTSLEVDLEADLSTSTDLEADVLIDETTDTTDSGLPLVPNTLATPSTSIALPRRRD